MNIAVAASEGVPFAKTGGLADVVGSLSQQLAKKGHRVALFLPLYKAVSAGQFKLEPVPGHFWIPIGEGLERARLAKTRWDGVDVYFVDNPKYFDRDELYGSGGGDYLDNDERFIFFSRAVLEGLKYIDLKPDVLHCHDWQTALVPAYLKTRYHTDAFYSRTGNVLTVHNMAYQGQFTKDALFLAGFGWSDFTPDKLEFYGGVNFMKAGLVYADALTTVSPTYAREIQTKELGAGMDGVLRQRAKDLLGVLNGLDVDFWNPASDAGLPEKYSASSAKQGKAAAKRALQQSSGLDASPRAPLIGIVSRLEEQKGLDLAPAVLEPFLAGGAQAVVVGTGQPDIVQKFEQLAAKFPTKVAFKPGYDEALAHRAYAACDVFLMPSRFEPCGLGQMIAMRYGSVPVVTRTGGLADTVADATERPREGNGFVAAKAESADIAGALERALAMYAKETDWSALMRRCMETDFAWERSAALYVELFEKVAKRAAER
jgi:starch synthase